LGLLMEYGNNANSALATMHISPESELVLYMSVAIWATLLLSSCVRTPHAWTPYQCSEGSAIRGPLQRRCVGFGQILTYYYVMLCYVPHTRSAADGSNTRTPLLLFPLLLLQDFVECGR